MTLSTALSLVEAAPGGAVAASANAAGAGAAGGARGPIGATELAYYCGPHDLKRLGLYSRNLVDYHLITDLLPMLSKLYFLGRMPSTRMSHLQEAILLAMGLQHRYSVGRALAHIFLALSTALNGRSLTMNPGIWIFLSPVCLFSTRKTAAGAPVAGETSARDPSARVLLCLSCLCAVSPLA